MVDGGRDTSTVEVALMSLLTVPIGSNAPHEVHAIIEIPKGSSNKYEYDLKLNAFVLDRVLFSPLHYPCDYGWVAGTLSEDGDPLDILVLGTHPNYPGCVVIARRSRASKSMSASSSGISLTPVCRWFVTSRPPSRRWPNTTSGPS